MNSSPIADPFLKSVTTSHEECARDDMASTPKFAAAVSPAAAHTAATSSERVSTLARQWMAELRSLLGDCSAPHQSSLPPQQCRGEALGGFIVDLPDVRHDSTAAATPVGARHDRCPAHSFSAREEGGECVSATGSDVVLTTPSVPLSEPSVHTSSSLFTVGPSQSLAGVSPSEGSFQCVLVLPHSRATPATSPSAALHSSAGSAGSPKCPGTPPAQAIGARHVSVVQAPCFRPVVSPLLIVFDLDNTILNTHLSSISLSDQPGAECFLDPEFFVWFCETVYRQGHLLAIASLTDGPADRHLFRASAAEMALHLLNAVLPADRPFLCTVEDVLCQPQSRRDPGKLSHLQALQQRLNNAWRGSVAGLEQLRPRSDEAAAERNGSPPLVLFEGQASCRSSTPGNSRRAATDSWSASLDAFSSSFLSPVSSSRPAFAAPPLPSQPQESWLPSWLSTDVLLVDDSVSNCELADHAGFRAACCAGTGFTRQWFKAQTGLHKLLRVDPVL